jgi:hypothetical protein
MANGHHNHQHNHGSGGTATITKEPAPAKVASPCGPPPIETSTCCDLVCFERPRYFCGHLLKDTDLTREQQYVMEKHKLYNRTLHGHGVVCGLRLTCDSTCCGDVRIDEGYAIDDCGNDIVVCERARFDVMARLKEKGLLIPTAPKDPCDPDKEVSPCVVRQCFYVVICYQETEHDFTTPLSPACGPSPKDCEATRVRETYTFDVVDRLPARSNPLADLRCRIEHCFTIFTDPPFAAALADVRRIVCANGDGIAGTPNEATHYKPLHDLYCKLRGLLLLYLRKHPDEYNCRLESDILDVKFPTEAEVKNGANVEHVFCHLIELALNHALSCVFGALAFPCPEPARAACVVLGTVEVEDDCVVRVCNCPRDYVWTFPSFFQVLFNTLASGLACETVDAPDERYKKDEHSDCNCKKGDPTQTCCRTYSIDDCCRFIERMLSVGKSVANGSTAMFTGAQAVQQSLAYAFDPTRWDTLPASAFVGKKLEDLHADPYLKDVKYHVTEQPLKIHPLDPIQAVSQAFMTTPADRFVLETDPEGRVVAAQAVPALYARVTQLEDELAALKVQLGGLSSTLAARASRQRTGGRGTEGGQT